MSGEIEEMYPVGSQFQEEVIGALSGDTLVMESGLVVKLFGFDAPVTIELALWFEDKTLPPEIWNELSPEAQENYRRWYLNGWNDCQADLRGLFADP